MLSNFEAWHFVLNDWDFDEENKVIAMSKVRSLEDEVSKLKLLLLEHDVDILDE